MNYDVNYFIKKFEAIPDELWFIGDFVDPVNGSAKCAFGHCGMTNSIGMNSCNEGAALHRLTKKYMVADINDGLDPNYRQPTPKQRILAALYDIKKLQEPQHTDITKQLAVLPVNETSDLITTNILQ